MTCKHGNVATICKYCTPKEWDFIKPEKTIPELERGQWTGWLFTDCSVMVCPKCGAPKFHHCVTPSGRKAWPPHGERTQALIDTGYDAYKRGTA